MEILIISGVLVIAAPLVVLMGFAPVETMKTILSSKKNED
jgi:hypothetical protein